MITWLALYLQKIEGANLFAVVVAAMWVLYLAFFFVVKANRTKKAIKTAVITGAVVTFISDIIWFINFFDNLDYKNPGLSGLLWIVVLPILMFLSVMILSYINASRYEFDKKKREKLEAKQKKKEKHRKKFENENVEK